MSFQLVIAEKPSVARSIAAVIGATEKQTGYWQGGGIGLGLAELEIIEGRATARPRKR